jgi:hypothetical protein
MFDNRSFGASEETGKTRAPAGRTSSVSAPKAGGCMPELCGLKSGRATKERGSDTTWDLNRREPFGRVKIVLAALVDDPKVALPRRVLIRDGSIDLV